MRVMMRAVSSNAHSKAKSPLLKFSTSAIVMMAATMFANILVIRWLATDAAGIWQTVMVAQSYAMFLQLGLINGLSREYPVLIGRDDIAGAHRMAATTLGHVMICSTVALLGFGVVGAVSVDGRWQLGWLSVAVSAAAMFYSTYLATTYRSSIHFFQLANVNLWYSVLVVASVVLVGVWGFEGLCYRIMVLGVGQAALLHRTRPVKVKPRWEWECVKPLLSAGTPLLIMSHLIVLADGFDRLILLSAAGITTVGLFAPSLALRSAFGSLPGALNQYIAPRLGIDLGKHDDPRKLWPGAWKSTLATLAILIPAAALAWALLPWAINLLFPAYVEGTRAAQLMAVASIFLSIRVGTAATAILKDWLAYGIYSAATCVLMWSVPWYLAQQMNPLEGVAMGAIIARGLSLVIGLATTWWACHRHAPPQPSV